MNFSHFLIDICLFLLDNDEGVSVCLKESGVDFSMKKS